MLNLLSVLQQLSVKIKVDKVDAMYPYHPRGRLNLKDDSRLKYSSQEVTEWLEKLS